jgi:hypothetical protein
MHQLNNQAEDALISILGKNIAVSFPNAWVDINREGVSSSSVSVFLFETKSYVVVDSDRAETAEGIDYSLLKVYLDAKPLDIEDPDKATLGESYNVCALLTWNPIIIQRISIYESARSFESKSLTFDSAILFEYTFGRILFSGHDVWPDRIEINHKFEAINYLLETRTARKVLEK